MSENFTRQLERLPELLAEHLALTVTALGVGTAICLPVAVLLTKWKPARWPTLTSAGIIQTIPSLALLALMVPVLDMVPGVSAFGYWPAIVALTLYSMLPILRNTVTGIVQVDPAMTEAARGLGMTPMQMLFKVELPLALPMIIAGLRTATVWVVGIATLSTPIGQPSLGNYIFGGLRMQNWTEVLFGCIAAALLAIVLDALIAQLEIAAQRRSRPRMTVATAALILLLAGGLAGPQIVRGWSAPQPIESVMPQETPQYVADDKIVRIGGKTFVEQYILARLLRDVLRDAGYEVQIVENLGSTFAFNAVRQGDIDLYVEYTGTVWVNYMQRDEPAPAWQIHATVVGWLAQEHEVRVAAMLGFENAYALAMARDRAEALGIRRIDDLAAHAPQLSIASDYEFFARPEWHRLREAYGLHFEQTVSFDSTFMYQAVARGEVDVITAFSSDGRIAAYDLLVLEDTRQVFPPYEAMVLLSPQAAQRTDLVEALRSLHGVVSVQVMRHANQLVDVERMDADDAAVWLRGQIAVEK